jgi:hypothetical protein
VKKKKPKLYVHRFDETAKVEVTSERYITPEGTTDASGIEDLLRDLERISPKELIRLMQDQGPFLSGKLMMALLGEFSKLAEKGGLIQVPGSGLKYLLHELSKLMVIVAKTQGYDLAGGTLSGFWAMVHTVFAEQYQSELLEMLDEDDEEDE